MPDIDHASTVRFSHQLFHGTTWHSRLLPSVHKFTYPYRYWGVNITSLAAGQALPEVGGEVTLNRKLFDKLPISTSALNKLLAKGLPLFSARHKALQQFRADDYLQGDDLQDSKPTLSDHKKISSATGCEALLQRLNLVFKEKTESAPTGDIVGLVVCRNVGLYFSPVNFYIGFDEQKTPTHLLAEVSNTPWDKRHYYGFLLAGEHTEFCHDKDFHVSPFNPIDQLYRWQVSVKAQSSDMLNTHSKTAIVDNADNQDVFDIRIAINISDERGEVLKTGIKMSGEPMTASTIRNSLKRNPLMNMTSLTRIYWHAFKLYAIKKVPYVNYDEKLADSEQGDNSK